MQLGEQQLKKSIQLFYRRIKKNDPKKQLLIGGYT